MAQAFLGLSVDICNAETRGEAICVNMGLPIVQAIGEC